MKPWIYVALLLTTLAACNQPLRVQEYKIPVDTAPAARSEEQFYVIGPGDVLDVVVWKETSVSGRVRVRPDGFISLPLVNEVRAADKTTAQLRQILQQKYKRFIADPVVTIRVEEITSIELFLLGEVKRPGVYPAMGRETLIQLLARAGGLTPFADRGNIRVVRRRGENVKEFTVDYNSILQGDLKQDILLRPGDRIIVP